MSRMPARSMFSMQSFHLSLFILGSAINETEKATQAPDKLVGHCAVNAVFSAVQGLVDFERPDGGVSPVANISWIIGETGERKSTVDQCFFRAAHEFRMTNVDSTAAEIRYRLQKKVWNIRERTLHRRLKDVLDNDPTGGDLTLKALMEHASKEPKEPKAVTFLFGDTSPLALKRGLLDYPAACVHSTDAMSILRGALFNEKTLLCELFSGDTHYFDRNGRLIPLHDRRLCVSAHSQPQRTLSLLRDEGEDFRDSGLAARMTVCYINNSTQGERTYDSIVIPTTARDRFSERMRHLLEVTKRAARRPNFKRRRLKLSPEAAREYLAYANSIEQEMRSGGRFQDMRDYANRLADKVGRLAAALHLFEGYRGDISLGTFLAARSFYDEATKDFEYLFNYLPSNQCLADLLLVWLRNLKALRGQATVKKAYILTYCPSKLRKKSALDPALALLEQQGHLYLERDRSGTTWVCLGPRPGFDWATVKPHQLGGWLAK